MSAMPRYSLRFHSPRSFCLLAGSLLLVLSGCATPQERCIGDAQREIRALDADLARVSANIARGFAVFEAEIPVSVRTECTRPDGTHYPCDRVRMETRTEAVPLDIEAEERKRDRLEARLADARSSLPDRIAACQRAFPGTR